MIVSLQLKTTVESWGGDKSWKISSAASYQMSAFYFLAIQGVLFIHSRKYRRVFVNSVLVIYSSITKCHQTAKINSHLLSQCLRIRNLGVAWLDAYDLGSFMRLLQSSCQPGLWSLKTWQAWRIYFLSHACVSWQASFSSSPYGPHHRATHNMAPTRAHGERERENTSKM